MTELEYAPHTPAEFTDEEGMFVRSLAAEAPGPLGPLVATVVVLVSIGLTLWSLVATWLNVPNSALPFFPMLIAGSVVSLNALYARHTFSYVLTVIGAVLWVWVTVTPFVPFIEIVLQGVTVTIMIAGVVFSLAAVQLSKKPRW